MLFRTLRSIEFQGPCSRDLNLGQSENCVFRIYGPMPSVDARTIRASLDDKKQVLRAGMYSRRRRES
jgi:hypothetical protein